MLVRIQPGHAVNPREIAAIYPHSHEDDGQEVHVVRFVLKVNGGFSIRCQSRDEALSAADSFLELLASSCA